MFSFLDSIFCSGLDDRYQEWKGEKSVAYAVVGIEEKEDTDGLKRRIVKVIAICDIISYLLFQLNFVPRNKKLMLFRQQLPLRGTSSNSRS